MGSDRMRGFLLRISWALRILLVSASVAHGQSVPTVLIANNSGVESVTQSQLRDILLGRVAIWPSGKPVILVLPGTRHPDVSAYARQVHAMDVTSMQKYWLAQVFQGRTQPPVFLESTEAIIRYVQSTDGAVAYIPTGTQVPTSLLIPRR